jgi:DNA invertase Pin-like site-specific DNA recombinase
MMADSHARKFDGIAVWKLDRLGRSLKHLVTVIEDLGHYGVSFVSLRDNLDLSTPAGRLMMHLLGAMAEFERSLIQERVVAGIAAARKRGVRMGRPNRWVRVGSSKIMMLCFHTSAEAALMQNLNCNRSTSSHVIVAPHAELAWASLLHQSPQPLTATDPFVGSDNVLYPDQNATARKVGSNYAKSARLSRRCLSNHRSAGFADPQRMKP